MSALHRLVQFLVGSHRLLPLSAVISACGIYTWQVAWRLRDLGEHHGVHKAEHLREFFSFGSQIWLGLCFKSHLSASH